MILTIKNFLLKGHLKQRKILMLNCNFIIDLEKGLLPGPSTPDQVEVQTFASKQNEDDKSGTDLEGKDLT